MSERNDQGSSAARDDRARRAASGDDDAIIDDGQTLEQRMLETELAGKLGSDMPGVVEVNGEKRMANDPGDPALDMDRTQGEVRRVLRDKDSLPDDSFAPVPPPPARDDHELRGAREQSRGNGGN